MIQDLAIVALLAAIGWCLWVRRATWRYRLRRALSLSVALTGVGILLTAPVFGPSVLWDLVGIQHFKDYLGHVCFLAATCLVIYALLCRVVPDHDVRRLLMHRAAVPAAAGAALMLAMITRSPRLQRPTGWQADFFDVPCEAYLRTYWTVYTSVMVYLLGYMIRLLWVLRRDPRSRLTANLYVVASLLGIGALTAAYINVWLHFMVSSIWLLLTAPPGVAAMAAAWSWRRQRHIAPRATRRRPQVNTRTEPSKG